MPAAMSEVRPATPDADPPPPPSGMVVVPEGLRHRGFALYVGLRSDDDGSGLRRLEAELRRRLSDLVPAAESYASIVFSPVGTPSSDLDVVRLALQEPIAIQERTTRGRRRGVVIDLTRTRLRIDGELVETTPREFALLRLLISRAGAPVSRGELLGELWRPDEETPVDRTVDVLVGRLRAKLRPYQGIVRTVRASGYRFDRHPDVTVLAASTPSPDLV